LRRSATLTSKLIHPPKLNSLWPGIGLGWSLVRIAKYIKNHEINIASKLYIQSIAKALWQDGSQAWLTLFFSWTVKPNSPKNEYVFLPYKRALFRLQPSAPKRICVFQQIYYLVLGIFYF
jgi:hypothetical protein